MRRKPLQAIGLLVFVVLFVGCEAKPDLFPASGTVSVKGKPVDVGRIIFERVNAGAEAISAIGDIKDGSFTLYTLEPGDGVAPGKYFPVILDPLDDTRDKRDRLGIVQLEETVFEVTAEGPNEFEIEITSKDLKYAVPDD